MKKSRGKYNMKKTPKERFDEKWIPEPNSVCWLWTGNITNRGYGHFNINGVDRGAHRASYELHCEKIPEGMFVCHKCDNPLCVNPDHLFIGSNMDNVNDMMNKDRHNKGTRHGRCKLTEEQVLSIYNDTRVNRIIAEEYTVTGSTIEQIKNGNSWVWLTGGKKKSTG